MDSQVDSEGNPLIGKNNRKSLNTLSGQPKFPERCPFYADLTVLARERPETPATEVFPQEDVDLLHTLLEAQGHRNVVRLPDGKVPDIRAVVMDLGRLVGSHPSPRQPLPGTKKVWQGLERLYWAIQVRDALGERQLE